MSTSSSVTVKITTDATLLPQHLGFVNNVFVNLHNVTKALAEDQDGMVTYLGTHPAPLMSTIEVQPYCFCPDRGGPTLMTGVASAPMCPDHISQHLQEYIIDTQFCRMLSERIVTDCAYLPGPFSVSLYVELIREVRILLPPSVAVRSKAASKDVFQRLLEEQTLDSLGDEEETTCSICMEDFSELSLESLEKIIRMPHCFHLFHQSCIFEWLKRQNSCPLCRRVPYGNDHETE